MTVILLTGGCCDAPVPPPGPRPLAGGPPANTPGAPRRACGQRTGEAPPGTTDRAPKSCPTGLYLRAVVRERAPGVPLGRPVRTPLPRRAAVPLASVRARRRPSASRPCRFQAGCERGYPSRRQEAQPAGPGRPGAGRPGSAVELVADSPDGDDVLGGAGVALQLLPQVADVHLEQLRLPLVVGPPGEGE